jgi:hypothetical protein
MKVQTGTRHESWGNSNKDTGCVYIVKKGHMLIRRVVISDSCLTCPLPVCKLEPIGGAAALNLWKMENVE